MGPDRGKQDCFLQKPTLSADLFIFAIFLMQRRRKKFAYVKTSLNRPMGEYLVAAVRIYNLVAVFFLLVCVLLFRFNNPNRKRSRYNLMQIFD